MQCYLRYSLGAGWFVLPCAIVQQSSFLIIHQLLCGYLPNPHHKPTLNLSREKTKKYKHTALISTTTKAICTQIGHPLLAWQLHWSFIPSALLYYTPPWLNLTLLHSTTLHHGSTWLYFTLPHSTMAQLDSTSLYYTLPWLNLTLLDSTTLYHGSTCLYLTLLHSTMAQLDSTSLYYTLPWLNVPLLDSTWLYFPLLHSTMALFGYTHLECKIGQYNYTYTHIPVQCQ